MYAYKHLLAAAFLTFFLLVNHTLPVQSQDAINKSPIETILNQSKCMDWTLATDFRTSPDQENPNRDSCGNLNVWYFMESTGLNRDPQTYSLLPYFTTNSGVEGLEKWSGSTFKAPPHGLPEFMLNTTGTPQDISYIVPPDVINAHPGDQTLAIAGWRCPLVGSVMVNITGAVKDLNNSCGDGVLWYIDKGAVNLASGSVLGGGSQKFSEGTGGNLLGAVYVNLGDFIYFIIHPNSQLYCDSTQLDIYIHLPRILIPMTMR